MTGILHQMLPYAPFAMALALSFSMGWVIFSDLTRYLITNNVNLTLLVLYAIGAAMFGLHVLPALGTALVILIIGMAIFALGLMGGGDVKLLVVLALWTSWTMATPEFIFMTAMAGGVLVVVVLMLRFLMPQLWVKLFPARNLPRILTGKQPIPYGIAIAIAFAWLLWSNSIPGFPPITVPWL